LKRCANHELSANHGSAGARIAPPRRTVSAKRDIPNRDSFQSVVSSAFWQQRHINDSAQLSAEIQTKLYDCAGITGLGTQVSITAGRPKLPKRTVLRSGHRIGHESSYSNEAAVALGTVWHSNYVF